MPPMPDAETPQPTVPADIVGATPDNVAQSGTSQFGWKWGLGIITAGVVLETLVWQIAPDSTYQVMWSMPVVSGTALLLVIWWIFFCGGDNLTLSRRLAALTAPCIVLITLFRFEGFAGDMWPQFQYRFAPSAEEQLQTFLATGATTSRTESGLEQQETDWTGFRGPDRDGIAFVNSSEFDWSQPPEELWRHPVGRGWSSFSVVSGRAYTQEQRGDLECVVCYDISSGQQIWVHTDSEQFEETLGGPGPRATPAFHDNRLYSLGATGLLNCLDASNGSLLWQKNILDEARAANIPWAMAGSPLVIGNAVVVNPGGNNANALIAFDRVLGNKVWSAGSDQASYSAPSLRTFLGQQQIIIFDGEGVKGHVPDSGAELWRIPWTNSPKVNAAVPVQISDNSLLVSSGYSQGSALIELTRQDDLWQTKTIWTSRRFKLKFNAAVQKGELAFGLDEGILACLNTKTGKLAWKRGRYGYGQLLLAGDVIVVQAENGDIAYVEAVPEKFNELLRFPAINGTTWNHPVIWNGMLLVRNGEEAACYRLPGR